MRTFCLMMVTVIAFLPGRMLAQDMEPRAYSNAPVGMNFLVTTYGHSSGNVIVDATLPIDDSEAKINTTALAYVRVTDFFGRSGKDEVKRNDEKSNWRYGFTFSVPLAKQHSLKFLISNGLTTRFGANFSTIGTAYQYVWGGNR
jgi:hypothetical protein